ncbi:MAG: HEAT repeat domain-containing protein [Candidatus Hydrogenedentota bacterium]
MDEEKQKSSKDYEITDKEWKYLTGELSYNELTESEVEDFAKRNRKVMASVLAEALSLRRNEEGIASSLVWALGELKYYDAFNILSAIFQQTKNPNIKEKIIYSLGQIGNEGAMPYLLQVLKNPNESLDMKWNAAMSIKLLGREKEIEPLMDALRKKIFG